jgi:hypothetical protein
MQVPPIPFPFVAEDAAFIGSFAERVGQTLERLRGEYMSSENTQSFMHGVEWQPHNSSSPDEVSTLQRQSFYLSLPKEQIIEANVIALFQKADELAAEIDASTRQMLYTKVSEAAERVGNTVNAKSKAPAEAFYEMIQRLEFGVNRNGEPTRPQIHLGTEALQALRNDPLQGDPAFAQKMEALIQSKMNDARARETERVARFK